MKLDDIILNILTKRSSTIFTNREVLRPDYVPEYLPHREEQIKELTNILAPLLNGERPSNVFIYGLTGTGKTAVTKYVIRKVNEYANKLKGVTFIYTYINCRHEDTTYRVLRRLAGSLNIKIPFTGLSTAEVFSRVVKAIENIGKVVVVVLDEVDFLVKKQGDDLLYRLTRVNDELAKGKVSVIGITNDVRFMERLDPRVKSSLGEVEMVFPPYDAIQLSDILRERAKLAFREGVIKEGVIEYCASIAAKEHGDARRALDLLRVAGEIAEREGASGVTVEHVKKAREELERDMVIDVIKTMPYHGKIILLTLALNNGRVESTGELYIKYREMCRKVALEPVTQRRISDLISELDMLGIINARIINRGRYGKTRQVTLTVSPQTVLKALSGDLRLEEFIKKYWNR